MKTLLCLFFALTSLHLYAAAPVQALQAIFYDQSGTGYWMTGYGSYVSLRKISITSDAGVTPITYAYPLQFNNATQAKVTAYLGKVRLQKL
jgi:hypothetical protein